MTANSGTGLQRYVMLHVATTCDEHGVYVTKDSAEVIELGWLLLDSSNCEEIHRESVLVKPVNTPITPLCTSLTTLTWEHVRNAGTFRDAINRFDSFAQEHLTSKNLDFAFVTLDSWDLRVQLPREARDKAVVLPPYLQHSKTFDLRTEYQRWQQYHPESLPFGASALTNICAALEVEPVQSSAPIKHNLPFHLQALAPSSPRRALEEAVTLTRVLHGLIRKSQPNSEHPDVLTRPLDSRADVRAFLGERSKVLHMSGLPHDTTQSELESWYTQFGGRPIAFWTLKTPDQHKPTGTGFAIFSSHEEAAESLCMNGRALNEKAIEVSPSSNRVLERAADILTPFPPSKNRPRPGDWTCPSCGFSNFQRRTACFRCSYPAMGEQPQSVYGGYGYGHPGMMHPPHHNGHQQHHMGGGGGHRGGKGEHHVPFRPGDWRCSTDGCNYHNFAKNVSCLRCGASRASALNLDPHHIHDHGSTYGIPHHAPAGGYGAGGPSGYASSGYGAGFGGPPPPPSTFALPSGLAGGPNPYAPPQLGGFVPTSVSSFGTPVGRNGMDGSGAFSPTTSSSQNHSLHGSGGGPNVYASGGGYGSNGNSNNAGNGNHNGTNSAAPDNDPFTFLNAGVGNLSVGGPSTGGASVGQSGLEDRRNGAAAPQTSKSPA